MTGHDVKAYGGAGDGVTDDTASLVATVAAASLTGLPVDVTAGVYRLTATVIIPAGVLLRGHGRAHLMSEAAGSSVWLLGTDSGMRNLSVDKTTATPGAAVFVSGDDCRVARCELDSDFSAIRIGDPNLDVTPRRARVENCRASGLDSVIVARTGRDGETRVKHRITDNEVVQNGVRPGIELWTGHSLVRGNDVRAPGFNGGTGGITVGSAPHQRILGNHVEGFMYGIEAGNIGNGVQVDHNHVVSCGTGIAISSIGGVKDEAVALGSNVVVMTPSFTAGSQMCIDLTGCRTATIAGGTLMYSDPARSCIGVKADSDVRALNMVGVQMVNLDRGVRAGVVPVITLTGCTWDNVKYPIDDTGGQPVIIVNGGRMSDCYHSIHNHHASYLGAVFTRAVGHPAYGKGFAAFYEPLPGVATVRSCQFDGVLDTTMIPDASRALADGAYKRPRVEHRDHDSVISTGASRAEAVAVLTGAGIVAPSSLTIRNWVTDTYFLGA